MTHVCIRMRDISKSIGDPMARLVIEDIAVHNYDSVLSKHGYKHISHGYHQHTSDGSRGMVAIDNEGHWEEHELPRWNGDERVASRGHDHLSLDQYLSEKYKNIGTSRMKNPYGDK